MAERIDTDIRDLAAAVYDQRAVHGVATGLLHRSAALDSAPLSELHVALQALQRGGRSAAVSELVAATADANAGATLATLPSDRAAFVAAGIVAEATRAQRAAARKVDELSSELRAAAHRVTGTSLEPARVHMVARVHRDVGARLALFQHLSWGNVAGQLVQLLETKPLLVAVDLSGCFLGDQCVVTGVLPALRTAPHLLVLSLRANSLSRSGGTALREFAENDRWARALRVLDLRDNSLPPLDVAAVDAAMAARRALLDGDRSVPRRLSGALPRILSLDGFGMRAAAQLQWLVGEQRRMASSGRHVGELFDLIVTGSTGAAIACALAHRKPLARLEAFLDSLRRDVFATAHAAYYAEAAGRVARRWWTRGDYYSSARLAAAVDALFGDLRFDFVDTQVVVVLAGEDTVHLAASCELAARSLRTMNTVPFDVVRPFTRDVVTAAMASPTLFAPRSVGTAPVVWDAVEQCPCVDPFALTEAIAMGGGHVVSVSCGDEDHDASEAAMSAMQHLLAAAAPHGDHYTHIHTVAPYVTAAVSRSCAAWADATPSVAYRRIVTVPPGAALPSLDDASEHVAAAFRECVEEHCLTLAPLAE